MLVVDASAVAELLLGRPGAHRVAEVMTAHDDDLHAPHLLDVEVVSALRGLALRHELDDERAEQALVDVADLDIERYPHEVLVRRAWELRHTFSAYDAFYVALAEGLSPEGAVLLTADRGLARAAATLVPVEAVA